MPASAEHLQDCLSTAFALLSEGAENRRSTFHTPVLGTTGLSGAPHLRTVVLRSFDPASRLLRLHTDTRSAKVAQIAAHPAVMIHAYDAVQQIQLQLGGHATLHATDAIADQAWAESQPQSRLSYAATPGPGTTVPEPPPAPLSEDGARQNFAAVLVHFDSLEFLLLAAAGHRRARFTWDTDGAQATWLAP